MKLQESKFLSGFAIGAYFASIASLYLFYKVNKKRKNHSNNSKRKYSFSKGTTEQEIEEFNTYMKKEVLEFNSSSFFESIIPRKISTDDELEKFFLKRFNYSKGDCDLKGFNEALLVPIYDLMDRGGKRWRPIICKIITQCFRGNWKDVEGFAAICEFIHNGSLVADDIEDESDIRRGKKSIHLIYGIDIGINLSCFFYFAALNSYIQNNRINTAVKLQILETVFLEMTHIHIGQAWDLHWHNKVGKGQHSIPTFEQYLEMVSNKTGVLMRLAVRITCIVLGLDKSITEKLVNFAEAFGVAFQIQDDILNLVSQEYSGTKGFLGEDIHEGKISLIIIHCLNNTTEANKKRLLQILSSHTDDPQLISEVIRILQSTNSIKVSEKIGKDLVINAWKNVSDCIPEGNSKLHLFLLAKFCVERKM